LEKDKNMTTAQKTRLLDIAHDIGTLERENKIDSLKGLKARNAIEGIVESSDGIMAFHTIRVWKDNPLDYLVDLLSKDLDSVINSK